VSFAAITLYVASQRVFIVVSIYFVIDSVWKLMYTPRVMGFVCLSEYTTNIYTTFAVEVLSVFL